mgnify:CR=1 FL=1
MTISDIHEVLIPAMEGVFATKNDLGQFATKKDLIQFATKRDLLQFATKKDLEFLEATLKEEMSDKFVVKAEFSEFRDSVLTSLDKTLKSLDILLTEKEVGNFQKKKERKLWQIMIEGIKQPQHFTAQQLKQIDALDIF